MAGKPTYAGGLTFCFLAETQRSQRWHVFFAKTESFYSSSFAFSAPLRE